MEKFFNFLDKPCKLVFCMGNNHNLYSAFIKERAVNSLCFPQGGGIQEITKAGWKYGTEGWVFLKGREDADDFWD